MSIKSCKLHKAEASKTLQARFDAKCSSPDPNGCINWRGALTASGYGKIYFGFGVHRPRQVAAHRAAWILKHGSLEPEILVLHRCDNKLCVNAEHLFTGSPADNVRDMVSKDRHFGPEWRAKKAGEVERIKDLKSSGILQKQIARWLGISRTSVSYVLNGRYRYSYL